jgi:hypothetical protein
MPDKVAGSLQDRLYLRAGQLSLHCRQAIRVPVAGVLVSLFFVHLLWPTQSHAALLVWAFALCAVLCARAAVSALLLRKPPQGMAIERWANVMAVFNLASGVIGGASAPAFLPGACPRSRRCSPPYCAAGAPARSRPPVPCRAPSRLHAAVQS